MFYIYDALPLGVHNSKGIESLSFIGSGNVAWHLAQAFCNAGLDICHIISRNPDTAKELAGLVNAEALSSASEIESFPDLFIICVPDEAISSISSQYRGFEIPMVHTSGSTGIEVLSEYTNRGVLYPLQTFSKNKSLDYSMIPFFIEANSEVLEEGMISLAGRISGKVRRIEGEERRKLHMAAVFACNFSNHMVHVASKLLKDEGMELELILPLIEETFSKLKQMDPGDGQTGPAFREDHLTIKKHLELLNPDSNEYKIYKLLSDNIIAYKQDE